MKIIISQKSIMNFPWNNAAQKMKFSIKDFFSKCDQIRSFVNVTKSAVSADLVTFTEEILRGKLHFLCSDVWNLLIPLNRAAIKFNVFWVWKCYNKIKNGPYFLVRIFRIWTEYRDLVMMQIQKKMKIFKDNMWVRSITSACSSF